MAAIRQDSVILLLSLRCFTTQRVWKYAHGVCGFLMLNSFQFDKQGAHSISQEGVSGSYRIGKARFLLFMSMYRITVYETWRAFRMVVFLIVEPHFSRVMEPMS